MFPEDRIVGTVDWAGAWQPDRGPVLATGAVTVPEGAHIDLHVDAIESSTPDGRGGWTVQASMQPVDLNFLRLLPSAAIDSLYLRRVVPESMGALTHLSTGLRRLYLKWSEQKDPALVEIAKLTGLTYLQTFGNHFTDAGVQRLVALRNLKSLYLEEETLTAAGFAFVEHLPQLERLGLQDVPLNDDELRELQERLPSVRVG